MANRIFKEKIKHLEPGPGGIVKLWLRFTTDGTGASTIVYGNGIATCVNGSAGVYTITLSDKYKALLGSSFMCSLKNLFGTITSEAVASTKVIVLTTYSGNSATDIVSGTAFVELTLRQ